MKIFPATLKQGENGPFAALLQTLLFSQGYNTDRLVADGIYGEQTAKAVRQFQAEWGQEETGQVDEDTRNDICTNIADLDKINLEAFQFPSTSEAAQEEAPSVAVEKKSRDKGLEPGSAPN